MHDSACQGLITGDQFIRSRWSRSVVAEGWRSAGAEGRDRLASQWEAISFSHWLVNGRAMVRPFTAHLHEDYIILLNIFLVRSRSILPYTPIYICSYHTIPICSSHFRSFFVFHHITTWHDIEEANELVERLVHVQYQSLVADPVGKPSEAQAQSTDGGLGGLWSGGCQPKVLETDGICIKNACNPGSEGGFGMIIWWYCPAWKHVYLEMDSRIP